MSMKHVCGEASGTTLTNVESMDIQPNAVDLRLDRVLKILHAMFELTETSKTHRGSQEIQPDPLGFWILEPGSYEVVMQNIISVGAGEAGWVITRSTLNRNGVFLTSGLYDSGYNGVMAGCMHVTTGSMRIQRGTRIGQYLSFSAEALHEYNGSYGLKSEHDKKYNT